MAEVEEHVRRRAAALVVAFLDEDQVAVRRLMPQRPAMRALARVDRPAAARAARREREADDLHLMVISLTMFCAIQAFGSREAAADVLRELANGGAAADASTDGGER